MLWRLLPLLPYEKDHSAAKLLLFRKGNPFRHTQRVWRRIGFYGVRTVIAYINKTLEETK